MNKERVTELAKDCHIKEMNLQALYDRKQKEKTPELAAEHAIATVEYRRAKKILDNEIAEQCVIIINPEPKVETTK